MQPARFLNRELSWLEFNQRVLEEAQDAALPLLERLKFLAITGSNLDEFFMVRVGGLILLQESGSRTRDNSGLTPGSQLAAIRKRVATFIDDQYRLLNDELLPALAAQGIRRLALRELSPPQRAHVEAWFSENILPILTPLAVDDGEADGPQPADALQIPDLQLAVACELAAADGGAPRLAVIPVPKSVPRFLTVPETEGFAFVTVEDLIAGELGIFFPGEEVAATTVFRVTRNGDIAVRDEEAADLADEMEEILAARRSSGTVRLEIQQGAGRGLVARLQRLCGADGRTTYRLPGLIDLKALFQLALLPDFERLQIEPWLPQPSAWIDPAQSIFDAIAERDILLIHPYESFDPVVRLVEEAADDPDVVAIKQILYRTAGDSRIIDALVRAAENRKHVTVVVELKARFDEARNLGRAEELRRAGAHILYGVRGLKTHAKALLVVRNEGGRLKRYVHFGTGNYNETTARLYTDVSYLTARAEYGADASAFFNAVTGRSRPAGFLKIANAPHSLKPRLLDLIQSEADRAAQGQPARIWAKMNSLQDPEIIEALYAASAAGVDIRLNVRGICCLRPGVKGLSENIRVVSIIDRYLEHARLFLFHQGGREELFLSSADWMTRNLEKRVELMVPVEDPASRKRLLRVLRACLDDNVKARLLLPDGGHERIRRGAREKARRAQEILAREARAAARNARRFLAEGFVPHLPKA
jgi:polyphosphate kinase